ncbi:hypothetical protein GH714_028022 [Hevea brasiliensis]|uniref:Protein TIFY n=2 Tax=Hevea brasiliensis TaxID=3981 RepID=D8V3L7_HEVBR|nr:plastid jasmonates ZIM-domain protein [Hevea brasiliensis]KAF2304142.1 hypothetical protein GH714_028022 [Hevea brasiliensis]
MAGSPEFVEFGGRKAAKSAEKSSFSQTCSLLSQYIKEKGSFGDLSLGMTCSAEGNGNGTTELRQAATTMNLFPMSEKQVDVSSRNMATPPRTNFRSMDLFPQQAGFSPSAPKEDVQKSLDSSVNKAATPEPQTAPMTIFYAGQVIVFNDFPADKVKEVMLLASKGSSQSLTGFPSVPVKSHPVFDPNVAKAPVESTSSIPPNSNPVPSFGNNLNQERVQSPSQTIASDLPIARRASLHRFLEKRKDRITASARAPYQTSRGLSASPSKPAESKPWLGLAGQSLQ